FIRRAAAIVPQDMVANWLYGVAHQTALKEKQSAAMHFTRERPVIEMPEPRSGRQGRAQDLEELLDQELACLPDKYRAAIVLCHLEGRTRKEAAHHLKIPEGTFSTRLMTARKMLAKRLSRQGLAMTAGTFAMLLTQK